MSEIFNNNKPSLIASNIGGAGLGNRMRFTLSALTLAEATGRDFFYVWPKVETFTPLLAQLWKFNESLISKEVADKICKSLARVEQFKELPEPPNEMPVWHFYSHDTVRLPEGLKGSTWGQRLRSLEPEESIARRIKSFYSENLIGKSFVGVMIRSHKKTNPKTLEASPVEWYVERMSELCSIYPGINFFISSDTMEAQDRIMEAFPTACSQIGKGEYGSDAGVISSVVDLYLLASSSYMLVPYFSSFPVLSQELCDKRVVLEHSRSGDSKVIISSVPLALDPLHPASREW